MVRKEGHNCEFYSGKIRDVTLRNHKEIHCRKCGDRLQDDEVDENTLQMIKNKKKNDGRR